MNIEAQGPAGVILALALVGILVVLNLTTVLLLGYAFRDRAGRLQGSRKTASKGVRFPTPGLRRPR